MWKIFSCMFSGHEYVVVGEPGHLLLRCLNCGRRSPGWFVREEAGDRSKS
jgi:hypothetical protein